MTQDILTERVPLAPLTTWRLGGPARYLVAPRTVDQIHLCSDSRYEDLPLVVLGRGSNVLVDDAGLNAVVLTTRFMTGLEVRSDCIVAEAGVPLPKLATAAMQQGWTGFDFMMGIPGTVGGGIAMNAGVKVLTQQDISGVLHRVTLWDRGETYDVTADDLKLGYRTSRLLTSGEIILRAVFRPLGEGDPASIHLSQQAHLAERKRKQPLGKRTAGSTFKAVPEGRAAGWYIDQVGLRGTVCGASRISPVHANWIETTEGSTASEVLYLMSLAEEAVHHHFSIQLEREVRVLPDDIALRVSPLFGPS